MLKEESIPFMDPIDALREIKRIINDLDIEDEECFWRIEKVLDSFDDL